MPLVLFLAGYLALYTWQQGMLGGLAGFALGVLLAVLYDRKVAKKNKPQYTIVGY
jgi:positive regulator of sigma E activity